MGETLDTIGSGVALAGAIGGLFLAGVGIAKLEINEGCHIEDAVYAAIYFADDLMPGKNAAHHASQGACESKRMTERFQKKMRELEKQNLPASTNNQQAETSGRLVLTAYRDDHQRLVIGSHL